MVNGTITSLTQITLRNLAANCGLLSVNTVARILYDKFSSFRKMVAIAVAVLLAVSIVFADLK